VPDKLQRDGLDNREQVRDVLAMLDRHGGDAKAAVRHEHAGETVPRGRRGQRVPEELGIVVRVRIDEAGGDHLAASLDDLGRAAIDPSAVDGSDRGDQATGDANVGSVGRQTRAVYDQPVSNDQVVVHSQSLASARPMRVTICRKGLGVKGRSACPTHHQLPATAGRRCQRYGEPYATRLEAVGACVSASE
jgi:hypothetical protein